MAKEAKTPKTAAKAAPKEVKFAVTLEDMASRLNMTTISLRDKCRRLGVEKHASGKYGWNATEAKAIEAKLKAGARGSKDDKKPAKKAAPKKAAAKKVNAKKPVAAAGAEA